MITRVRLKNFKSIAECDVTLGPLTILVGPNGSGKSNFLQALDFLADAVNNGLESAVLRRGGIDSLMSRWARGNADESLSIEIDLHLEMGRQATFHLAVGFSGFGGFKIIEERCTVDPNKSRRGVESYVVNESKQEWRNTRGYIASPPGYQEREKGMASGALTLPFFADHVYFRPVYNAIRGFTTYAFDIVEMRRPHEFSDGQQLRSSGANIASVMRMFPFLNESGWSPGERVLDYLAAVTPGIVDVDTRSLDAFQVLRFEQRWSEGEQPHFFSAGEMSDGTIRALGILVALYQRNMAGGSPVTLVAIEEPETAVHPGAATAILEAMAEASMTTQVLATTHSAAMLDHEDLDVEILRAVELHGGRTVIGPVDEASRRILEAHLASAGELLRMRHLSPGNGHDGSARMNEAAAPA